MTKVDQLKTILILLVKEFVRAKIFITNGLHDFLDPDGIMELTG